MEDAQYSFIYREIVTGDDDVVGLIAYGIYKKHKIEFITKVKNTLGREPTAEEFGSFIAASTTESQLRNYRSQAEIMLSETVGQIAGEELKIYENEMLRTYRAEISSCIPSNSRTFWTSIGAGFAASVLFTVIAGLFYFMGETSDRTTRDNTKRLMESVRESAAPSDSIVLDYK